MKVEESLMTMDVSTTTTNPWQLFPLPVQTGWSNFIRESFGTGAGELIGAITRGSYLEIKDNKFAGDSLVILRRSDFEQLVKSASVYAGATYRIKRILFSITESTRSYSDPSKAGHLINAISTQASLGLELTASVSAFSSDAEFLAAEAAKSSNQTADDVFPTSKADLKNGVKRQR